MHADRWPILSKSLRQCRGGSGPGPVFELEVADAELVTVPELELPGEVSSNFRAPVVAAATMHWSIPFLRSGRTVASFTPGGTPGSGTVQPAPPIVTSPLPYGSRLIVPGTPRAVGLAVLQRAAELRLAPFAHDPRHSEGGEQSHGRGRPDRQPVRGGFTRTFHSTAGTARSSAPSATRSDRRPPAGPAAVAAATASLTFAEVPEFPASRTVSGSTVTATPAAVLGSDAHRTGGFGRLADEPQLEVFDLPPRKAPKSRRAGSTRTLGQVTCADQPTWLAGTTSAPDATSAVSSPCWAPPGRRRRPRP